MGHGRLLGSSLALIVALAGLALASMQTESLDRSGVDWSIGLPVLVAAGIAGMVAGPRATRSRVPVAAVLEMAVLSYVLVILAFIAMAIAASLPAATNGGQIYCWRPQIAGTIAQSCPSGLFGGDALARVFSEVGFIAFLAPFAMIALSFLLVVPLGLSVVWAVVLRLVVRSGLRARHQ